MAQAAIDPEVRDTMRLRKRRPDHQAGSSVVSGDPLGPRYYLSAPYLADTCLWWTTRCGQALSRVPSRRPATVVASGHMSEHSIDDQLQRLLAEAGPAAARVRRVLLEVAQSLLEARVIVQAEVWGRHGQKDAFAKSFLQDVIGTPNEGWDGAELLGNSALPTLREVNARAHCYRATTGAVRYKDDVTDAQGGFFCSMCGARSGLVVDHIVPVSVGGPEDAVANMQLLCTLCNSGKSDLRDHLLPALLRHRTTPDVPPGMRFKHLLMDSVVVDGRTRGVCGCGKHSDSAPMRVTVVPPEAAANFLNLRTRCESCQREDN